MADPNAWLNVLAFLAGYGAAELQHRIRAHLRSMGTPRGSYGLPPDHDWRRTFNHENTNPPTGEPPLKFQRRVRFDEGRVQRSNSGEATIPKPEIIPKPQPAGGRLIRGDRDPGPPTKPEFPPPRMICEDFLPRRGSNPPPPGCKPAPPPGPAPGSNG